MRAIPCEWLGCRPPSPISAYSMKISACKRSGIATPRTKQIQAFSRLNRRMWSSLGRTAQRSSSLYRVLTAVPPSTLVPLEPKWSALICLRDFVHHSEGSRSGNGVLENGLEEFEDGDMQNSQRTEEWMFEAAPVRFRSAQPREPQVCTRPCHSTR